LGKNLILKLGRRQRRKEQQEWGGEEAGEEEVRSKSRSRSRERLCSPEKEVESVARSQETSSSSQPPPLPRKTVPPYQEYRFGPEESEPVMEKAGREKRRKKQAVRHFTFIFTFFILFLFFFN